jgi:hypothetical protein
MHGDAAWCEPLSMWVMVQQSGGRIRETVSIHLFIFYNVYWEGKNI